MDWKYLKTLSLEDLNDAEKDELFNMIAWYNSESDTSLNFDKCMTIFKLSQEILKYKKEQVSINTGCS